MIKSLILMTAFSFTSLAWAYPEIISWQNSPVVVFENKSQAVLTKKGLLKRPFAVVTANRDELELSVNHFDKLYMYEKSKIQVLDFSNDGNFLSEFYLLDGRIRYSTGFRGVEKSSSFEIIIKTPFSDLKLTNQVDFFVELNMSEAWIELKVVKGSLPIEFFAYEKKVTLVEGEQVRFQGVKADDKINIQYDYLLGGRKVPKGQLLEVKKFDVTQYLKADEAAREKEVRRRKDIELKRLQKRQKQKEYEDSFLCKKPFGQRNQCTWYVENGKCFRKRCNASGLWGDKVQRPLGLKCKSEAVASECDY
jgi:hypothetical protein